MPSVERISLALGAAVVAGGLAGCVTTQEKNSWLLLRNARQLAMETAVHVTSENPTVRVRSVDVVHDGRSSAVVVSIQNRGSRPLTDLPISVGVVGHGGVRTYLNGGANIDYYDTHVPAILAGQSTSWVLPGVRTVPPGRTFAVVGVARDPSSTTVQKLPAIGASTLAGTSPGELRIRLANDSNLPQYGLQVYAVALRRGADIGAGRVGVDELSGGDDAVVNLTLAGHFAGARLELYAPPTIFK